jgi:WS/DGAT/MGAT family acyltransferase
VLELLDTSGMVSPLTYERLVAHLNSRIHLAKSFRSHLTTVPFDLGNPYWVDDPAFDVEFHVRHLALPAPGTWRQLCTQVARLHARPIDLKRPPWELYLIEGLDNIDRVPAGGCALFLRIHHAAIDGVTGAEILNVLHDRTPEGDHVDPPDPWTPGRSPAQMELLGRSVVSLMFRPIRAVSACGRAVPRFGNVLLGMGRGRLPAPVTTVPRTRFNGAITPHRSVEGRHWPLEWFREIKSAVPGATVNDVAITVVAGALRRYLSVKDELPGNSLVCAVPVSLRAKQQTTVGREGNDIATMVVPMGTDVADDLERLEVVARNALRSKQRKQALGARTLTDIGGLLPGRLTGLAQRQQHRIASVARRHLIFNLPVTNVPGSRTPFFIAGARVVDVFGLGPVLDGTGILAIVGSYCGSLTITVTADRQMLPDPERFGDCLQETVEALSRRCRPSTSQRSKALANVR